MSDFTVEARSFAHSFRPPKGVAALAVVDRDGSIGTITSTTRHVGLFEAGSITKTFTATVLAQYVVTGAAHLTTTVGDVLGPTESGPCARVTFRELATHTSGLPRLPPGAMRPPFWPRDPYAFFTRRRLRAGARRLQPAPTPGEFVYSNFGYDLLAHCLERVGHAPLQALLKELIFEPLNMTTARCQPCRKRGLERGHGEGLTGGRRWHNPSPGGGGVDLSIDDLAKWLRANLLPESSNMADALRLAHAVHFNGAEVIGLAWHHHNQTIWHNGATGSFRSVAAIRHGRGAMGSLASCSSPGSEADQQILGLVGEPGDHNETTKTSA